MQSIEFGDFQTAIKPYGPDHRLADTAELYDCYRPDQWHDMIVRAGNLLRKEPLAQLIEKPLPEEFNGAATPHTTLFNILNASVERVQDADTLPPGHQRLDTCSYAEIGFASAIQSLECDNRVLIYADADARPLALGKTKGVPSALSLRPITLNGISYPSGSLLRIDVEREAAERQLVNPISILPYDTLVEVSFLRLSGFALRPEERAGFYDDDMRDLEPNQAHLLLNETVQHVGSLAAQTMERTFSLV